jgi:hypothetical protein
MTCGRSGPSRTCGLRCPWTRAAPYRGDRGLPVPVRHGRLALGAHLGHSPPDNHEHGRSLADTPELPFAWGNARCQPLLQDWFFPDTEGVTGSNPVAHHTLVNQGFVDLLIACWTGTRRRGGFSGGRALDCLLRTRPKSVAAQASDLHRREMASPHLMPPVITESVLWTQASQARPSRHQQVSSGQPRSRQNGRCAGHSGAGLRWRSRAKLHGMQAVMPAA